MSEVKKQTAEKFILREMNVARNKYGNGGFAEDFDEGFLAGFQASEEKLLAKLEKQDKISYDNRCKLQAEINLLAEEKFNLQNHLNRSNEKNLELLSRLEEKERECESLQQRLAEAESILKKIATDPAYYCSLGTHEAKEYLKNLR